jgi:uncharacterized protein YfaS (alpha-2-macroglobulin family)
VLVEDAYPAGCEPTERGTSEVESHDDHCEGEWWDNTEVRDDRIAFFARRLGPGRHVIEYTLRAQTAGSYSALPAAMAPMYAPGLRAESAENLILIDTANN